MLAMARQKNPQKMKHWAMISAGANYGRGIGEIVNRRVSDANIFHTYHDMRGCPTGSY